MRNTGTQSYDVTQGVTDGSALRKFIKRGYHE